MPCPFCHLTGGFHDEAPHAAQRALVWIFTKVWPGTSEARRRARLLRRPVDGHQDLF